MENYKKAAQLKLRIQTSVGSLSVEQLFELSLQQLSATATQLSEKLKREESGGDLSFLEQSVKVDPIAELSFNIVKDVYLTKKAEQEEARNEVEIKAYNAEIDAVIASKKKIEFNKLSIEELEKLRK